MSSIINIIGVAHKAVVMNNKIVEYAVETAKKVQGVQYNGK